MPEIEEPNYWPFQKGDRIRRIGYVSQTGNDTVIEVGDICVVTECNNSFGMRVHIEGEVDGTNLLAEYFELVED